MDDENKIRLKNALRLISASDEDLFFSANIVDADDGIEVKDPYDEDAYISDDPNEAPSPNQSFGKVKFLHSNGVNDSFILYSFFSLYSDQVERTKRSD